MKKWGKEKSEYTIGILGGMGTYATVHMFDKYAKVFSAEKEWDRPRVVIDNRCTMPSRVRAYLNGDNKATLIDMMIDSLMHLIAMGSDRIIMGCMTSHLFLPEIYVKCPQVKSVIIDLIDVCMNSVIEDGNDEVYLLASEGTIESGIFNGYKNINDSGYVCVSSPKESEFSVIRECIEAVKQNTYSLEIGDKFISLVNRSNSCILGCTELPILYEKYRDSITCQRIYDPVLLAFHKIRKEYLERDSEEE